MSRAGCYGARPLSRFPLPGESRGGRVPPTPGDTLRDQHKTLARIVRRLPPQEGCRPLVHPLRRALVQGRCIAEIPQVCKEGLILGESFTQNT